MGVRTASTMTTSRPRSADITQLLRWRRFETRSRTVPERPEPPRAARQPEPHPGADVQERLGIAGAGTIACGLAATAARHGCEVMLWARSDASADRART